jgi:hypothetical protein
MNTQGQATLSTALVMLLAVALGGPLFWGFAFSGLGLLTWVVAAFGWLPGDFFATNFGLLSRVAGVIAGPILAYACYRLAFQVHRVELALAHGTIPAPHAAPPAAPKPPLVPTPPVAAPPLAQPAPSAVSATATSGATNSPGPAAKKKKKSDR